MTVFHENEGGGYREGRAGKEERERERGRIESCILDWSIPAFGGGGPYMHVNSCCILYWGCYLIPIEWAETDVALQIMLVLICMLPEECALNGQEVLTTVQLSPLNSEVHFKRFWKAACTHTVGHCKLSCTHTLTFSLTMPLSKIETMTWFNVGLFLQRCIISYPCNHQ